MKHTLTILIVLLFTLTSCSQNIEKTSTEKLLAEKVIKSLKQKNKQMFKECLVPIDLFILQDINTTQKEYLEITNKWYSDQLNAFSEKTIDLKDYEIFKVLEPNWEYEKDGYEMIRFKVILKNSQEENIILTFHETVKYKNEYKLGERLGIEN